MQSEQRAKCTYDRFVEMLRDVHRQPASTSTDTQRGWGVVLARSGYRETAKAILAGTGELGPEVALLMIRATHAETAAFLRPFVSGSAGKIFPPALYFYCNALVDLGVLHEAKKLLDDSGLGESHPMACDLMGKMHERAGRWRQAFEAYGRSSWSVHKLRASMCRTILHRQEAPTSHMGALVVDEAMQRALGRVESEIDQTELARRTAFVNACRWNTYDDWLVRFELGKLSFRRRCYAEADAHLSKALALAPASARFVIASLRFTNLTWLTDNSLSEDLPMEPEALECAHAALKVSDSAGESANIRVWVASATRDTALLPENIDFWNAFLQAQAHAIVGNEPEALASGFRSLTESYYHRNLLSLIWTFSRSRFESCVEFLVELIVRESWNDFFAVWELATFLHATRSQLSESSQGFQRLSRRLFAVSERLVELSQFDFQHVMRAHGFFAKTNRQDLAEALAQRACKLAEGAAENLAVAIARRKAASFNAVQGDPQGLQCLRKAEKESRNRLERLQIARELFHHGRVQWAHRILEGEGVFVNGNGFDPIEYIVVLQCRPWLKPDAYQDLFQRAKKALPSALQIGAIERYAARFWDRLAETAGIDIPDDDPIRRQTAAERSTDEGSATTSDAGGLQASPWKIWRDQMQTAIANDNLEAGSALFEDGVARQGQCSSFELRMATWSWVYQQLEQALDTAAMQRPQWEPSETPISKSPTLLDERALQVSELWRRYLSAADAEGRQEARKQVESFYAMEKQLMAAWEVMRHQESERPLRRALFYAEVAMRLLPTLVSDRERSESHPLLRGLYECAALDSDRLVKRMAQHVDDIRRQLLVQPNAVSEGRHE